MKANLFVAMMALSVLCAVASAQNYSIRVTYNTNLRASYSLQARIVETAPAGTTLHVVGSANRWLQINRNGIVWMANWVSYSRVESSGASPSQGQTSTQTTSNIDNCCFVDRQCLTDRDWTDGYWAFQNNQCVAPSQTGGQTSSSVVSTTSSQIDNCCFVDRQCSTDAEWTNGYYAFLNNQCAAPAQTPGQTSTQPVSAGPAQIDNCCFAGWQCATDEQWRNGYQAYQNNACLSPQQSTTPIVNVDLSQVDNCCRVNRQCNTDLDWQRGYAAYQHFQCSADIPIDIDGSPHFISRVRAAFNLLKEKAARLYTYGISGLSRIIEVPAGSIIGVYVETRTFQYATDLVKDDEGPLIFLAGSILHEACHVHRWEAGLREVAWKEERACVEKDLEAVLALDPEDKYGNAAWYRDLIANLHKPEYWWWADDD